jgi:Fe-S-cluster containining protein
VTEGRVVNESVIKAGRVGSRSYQILVKQFSTLYLWGMKKQEKIRLDANKQALYFPGGCGDVETCRAVCCRNWNVLVDMHEEESQTYNVETVCLCTNNDCADRESLCLNRRTRLARKTDGSCVYLDSQNRCSIYVTRPVACQTFTCENGWKLSPQASEIKLDVSEPGLDPMFFKQNLRMDLVFVKNPAVEFKTSFYLKEDREIIMVVKRVDKCGTGSIKITYDNPLVTDDILSSIILSFDGTKDCAAVLHEVRDRFGIDLNDEDFLDIILLFHRENLLMFKMVPSLKQ